MELKAYRGQRNRGMKSGVIAVIDADKREVQDRVRGFDKACEEQDVPRRKPDECVLYVIPKRNIETWLAYLRGETVNEETAYPRHVSPRSCDREVDRLDAMCTDRRLEGEPPTSLVRCCDEFQNFWCLIQ